MGPYNHQGSGWGGGMYDRGGMGYGRPLPAFPPAYGFPPSQWGARPMYR